MLAVCQAPELSSIERGSCKSLNPFYTPMVRLFSVAGQLLGLSVFREMEAWFDPTVSLFSLVSTGAIKRGSYGLWIFLYSKALFFNSWSKKLCRFLTGRTVSCP